MGMAGEDAHVAGALTAIVQRAGRFLTNAVALAISDGRGA